MSERAREVWYRSTTYSTGQDSTVGMGIGGEGFVASAVVSCEDFSLDKLCPLSLNVTGLMRLQHSSTSANAQSQSLFYNGFPELMLLKRALKIGVIALF